MPRIHDHENEITYFGRVNFRNQNTKFGIKTDDRRRHVYVIGKTGMGKTTLLENFILQDIYNGHGCCYIDPHGDTVEKILDYIPSWRMNDVVYFNPSDLDFPIGFNVLESVGERHKHLVASSLMGVFKKIWENMWSARMEYILNNTILALLDTPGSTLLGINRMYSDADYRLSVVKNIKDPVVKQFWVMEYAAYSEKFATEAVAAVQNKVGQFLSAGVIRNIIAQVKSTINVREIMDSQKIFLVNLSKGRIGEDNSRLLGGMIVTKVQLAAMERVDTPEHQRKDFYLYVDEFQNFATESFADILSEARKYRLNLVVAHQYIAQLTDEVRDAVLGNVGTIISFRVGAPDAEVLAQEFVPQFTVEDIIGLPKFAIYLKLMIDGVASQPFSAGTLPPISNVTNSQEKVIRNSRERYGRRREEIEEKIMKWIGFDEDADVEEMLEASKARGSGQQQKKKHKYKCSWTGQEFSIPVKLNRSRPIYCEEGRDLVLQAKRDGSYDPRKDMIYDQDLQAIGSVAELGGDGSWAITNKDGDILGRRDGKPLPGQSPAEAEQVQEAFRNGELNVIDPHKNKGKDKDKDKRKEKSSSGSKGGDRSPRGEKRQDTAPKNASDGQKEQDDNTKTTPTPPKVQDGEPVVKETPGEIALRDVKKEVRKERDQKRESQRSGGDEKSGDEKKKRKRRRRKRKSSSAESKDQQTKDQAPPKKEAPAPKKEEPVLTPPPLPDEPREQKLKPGKTVRFEDDV